MSDVLKGVLIHGLNRMDLQYPKAQTSAMVTIHASQGTQSLSLLWHARLGHVSAKQLKRLSTSNLYRHAFPELSQLDFCTACAKGKIKQKPYSQHSSYRASELLELVHTDLCGPVHSIFRRVEIFHASGR